MIKVKLNYPIQTKDEEGNDTEIRTLKFGRVKLKHLKNLPKSFYENEGNITAAELIPFISSMTGLEEGVVEEIDVMDLEDVSTAAADVLKKHQAATGE